MNGFDYIALAAVAAAVMRGYRTGLSAEFYRLFRMAVSLLAGTGLYSLLSDAVTRVLGVTSGFADPLMFVGSSVVAWRLLQRLRGWMELWIKAKVPGHWQSIGGSIAAGLKSALLIGGVVTVFNLAGWLPGHDAVSEKSVTSQIVQFFLPET